jgi:hypothetical protein
MRFLGEKGNAKELFLSGSERLQRLVADSAADFERAGEGDTLHRVAPNSLELEVVGLVKLFAERPCTLHSGPHNSLGCLIPVRPVTPRVMSRRPAAFFSSTTSILLDALDTLDLSNPTSQPLLDALCSFVDRLSRSENDLDQKVLPCTTRPSPPAPGSVHRADTCLSRLSDRRCSASSSKSFAIFLRHRIFLAILRFAISPRAIPGMTQRAIASTSTMAKASEPCTCGTISWWPFKMVQRVVPTLC